MHYRYKVVLIACFRFALLFSLLQAHLATAQHNVRGGNLHLDTVTFRTFSAHDFLIGKSQASKQAIPRDLYTRNFGFFCKQELKMYKAGVPISFRVGTMDNCNVLEQKSNVHTVGH